MKSQKIRTTSTKYKIVLTIFSIFIFLAGSVTGHLTKLPHFSNQDSFEKITSGIDKIIEDNKNLSITQEIFNECSKKETGSEKMLCVNKYAVDNFNYKLRKDEVYSIDDMFAKGADCKSYSVYYATLASMMEYDYVFFQMPDHVMTLVDFKEGYCILDQKIGKCIYYEEGEN
ncbi:MAG: hypothetical protein OEL87_02570 [Nanoarchaeota archaeon]|nr:hypothetical protein [Nanoarchaeota archaeon]